MGVYIKGMEMPKSCWHCRFELNNMCRATINRMRVNSCDRHPDCPLIEVPPHEWIPVTDRLPEHHGHYLAHIEGGEFTQVSWEEIAYFNGKIFMWEHISSEYPEDVTHWMPLPQPPKADKDGGV